jgi:hypothetical protein
VQHALAGDSRAMKLIVRSQATFDPAIEAADEEE